MMIIHLLNNLPYASTNENVPYFETLAERDAWVEENLVGDKAKTLQPRSYRRYSYTSFSFKVQIKDNEAGFSYSYCKVDTNSGFETYWHMEGRYITSNTILYKCTMDLHMTFPLTLKEITNGVTNQAHVPDENYRGLSFDGGDKVIKSIRKLDENSVVYMYVFINKDSDDMGARFPWQDGKDLTADNDDWEVEDNSSIGASHRILVAPLTEVTKYRKTFIAVPASSEYGDLAYSPQWNNKELFKYIHENPANIINIKFSQFDCVHLGYSENDEDDVRYRRRYSEEYGEYIWKAFPSPASTLEADYYAYYPPFQSDVHDEYADTIDMPASKRSNMRVFSSRVSDPTVSWLQDRYVMEMAYHSWNEKTLERNTHRFYPFGDDNYKEHDITELIEGLRTFDVVIEANKKIEIPSWAFYVDNKDRWCVKFIHNMSMTPSDTQESVTFIRPDNMTNMRNENSNWDNDKEYSFNVTDWDTFRARNQVTAKHQFLLSGLKGIVGGLGIGNYRGQMGFIRDEYDRRNRVNRADAATRAAKELGEEVPTFDALDKGHTSLWSAVGSGLVSGVQAEIQTLIMRQNMKRAPGNVLGNGGATSDMNMNLNALHFTVIEYEYLSTDRDAMIQLIKRNGVAHNSYKFDKFENVKRKRFNVISVENAYEAIPSSYYKKYGVELLTALTEFIKTPRRYWIDKENMLNFEGDNSMEEKVVPKDGNTSIK